METVFAVGFDDQFPCARNRYNFGIGATLFKNEADAVKFKGTSLYSIQSFSVANAEVVIARQDGVQKRHAESLGFMNFEPPKRTA